jgi:hypothetical protein
MVGQESQGIKTSSIVYAIVALIVAAGYFTFLDYSLMNMQGLDYFYLFRK